MVVKPEDSHFLRGSPTRPNNQEEPLDLKLDSRKHVGDSPYEEDIAFAKPDASKVKCTGKGS